MKKQASFMRRELRQTPLDALKNAGEKAAEAEKIKGIREIALIGSQAKGIPLSRNSNYAVVIDKYNEKIMSEVKGRLGGQNASIAFITPKDLERIAKRRKQGASAKAVSTTVYVLTKLKSVEDASRKIAEIKLPRLRTLETEPRMIQTWVPISSETSLIKSAQRRQQGVMKPNPVFQRRGFREVVKSYLGGRMSLGEAAKFMREEPKAAEYIWRFIASSSNAAEKEKLGLLLKKLKKI